MFKNVITLLTFAILISTSNSEAKWDSVDFSGVAEMRFVDRGTKGTAQRDSFSFNSFRLDMDATRGDFDVHIGGLWDDATSTTSIEEAYIKWNGNEDLGVKMGRFVNSSYWNDRRYAPDHLSISVPNTENGRFIPMLTTGMQLTADLGSHISLEAAYGNGKDSATVMDNNDHKAVFAKAIGKLGNSKHNLWFSAAWYEDTEDFKNAAGATLRTNDYQAQQFEAGAEVGPVDVVGSYARSKVKDRVLGETETSSWFVQPSLSFGGDERLTFYTRWEDFDIEGVLTPTVKTTKIYGFRYAFDSDVVGKLEFSQDDFDLRNVVDTEDILVSLSIRF